jgi:hypothetical protein
VEQAGDFLGLSLGISGAGIESIQDEILLSTGQSLFLGRKTTD